MTPHDLPDHSNLNMGATSLLISLFTMLSTSLLTGEGVHWLSGIGLAVFLFLLNKGMHYFWDKYIKK
jgi:hypothetical protein